MDTKAHWDRVYATRHSTDVSWFQPHATLSLALIARYGGGPDARIIDVGGGASTLVDGLLAAGHAHVTVLDLSAAALAAAQARLGERAAPVTWIDADVTRAALSPDGFDVWHDRAVFHFLTDPQDRNAYVAQVARCVRPGGHVIVAAFAPDGPERCSGLPVVRYDAAGLQAGFGAGFALVDQQREEHRTPAGQVQQFVYCVCERR